MKEVQEALGQEMQVRTPMDKISALEQELKVIKSEPEEDDISSKGLKDEMKKIASKGQLTMAEMPVISAR